MPEALRLYRIIDPDLTVIVGKSVTNDQRVNGVLLDPRVAVFYEAAGQMRPFMAQEPAVLPPEVVRKKLLSEIFAPDITGDNTGEEFLLKLVDERLVLVEYQEPIIPEPGELADIGDVAQFFSTALKS